MLKNIFFYRILFSLVGMSGFQFYRQDMSSNDVFYFCSSTIDLSLVYINVVLFFNFFFLYFFSLNYIYSLTTTIDSCLYLMKLVWSRSSSGVTQLSPGRSSTQTHASSIGAPAYFRKPRGYICHDTPGPISATFLLLFYY